MVRPRGPRTPTNLLRHESEVGSLSAPLAAGVLVSVLWASGLLRPPVLLRSGVPVLLWPSLLSSPLSWHSRPVNINLTHPEFLTICHQFLRPTRRQRSIHQGSSSSPLMACDEIKEVIEPPEQRLPA